MQTSAGTSGIVVTGLGGLGGDAGQGCVWPKPRADNTNMTKPEFRIVRHVSDVTLAIIIALSVRSMGLTLDDQHLADCMILLI